MTSVRSTAPDGARVAIAGAGFSGAVIARELADAGMQVDVFEARPHVAGNCHTVRDAESGILLHAYGPHIFHTSHPRVWDYVRRFDEFMPFVNRVKAITGGRVYSLPVNLLTINQFFGKTFSPSEAWEFLQSKSDTSIDNPQTFEQQALRFMGRDLYEAFFKGYTRKQWGLEPRELPADILKRLPDKQQMIMALHYQEDLSYREIAAVMNLTPGRISQLHTEAMIAIRALMGGA